MGPYIKPGIMTVDETIDQSVAQSFDIDMEYLSVKSRKRKYTEARHFAMWWRIHNTSDILSDIGRRYGGRDHATVLWAKKNVENLMQTDKEFKRKAEKALMILDEIKI